jgi:hypothetical protein
MGEHIVPGTVCYTEFKILEKRLGKSALITVAPVVKINPADQKSLDDLLAECSK